MPELIPINILIGDRSYRIKTSPEDEEQIRSALKTINDKIIEFKTQFSGKDMQDYIAMVLIWFANQSASVNQTAHEKDVLDTLQFMERQLDKVL